MSQYKKTTHFRFMFTLLDSISAPFVSTMIQVQQVDSPSSLEGRPAFFYKIVQKWSNWKVKILKANPILLRKIRYLIWQYNCASTINQR